jgi:putative transposase
MKRSRFSEEQIIGVLKQSENGRAVSDLVRELGITETTYYLDGAGSSGEWKSRMRNARGSKSANCAKSNGDPGAIRTRDPQLRRLFRESCNLPVFLRYSENLVRSGSARRCHEVTRPRALSQRHRAESRVPVYLLTGFLQGHCETKAECIEQGFETPQFWIAVLREHPI